MLDVLVHVVRDLQRLGEMPDAGPFSAEAHEANAAAGAGWDARQGVRKAIRQLESGRHADALATLDLLLLRLPDGPHRRQVAEMAGRLRAAVASLPADGAADLREPPDPAV